jgi:stage V sporulation protein R
MSAVPQHQPQDDFDAVFSSTPEENPLNTSVSSSSLPEEPAAVRALRDPNRPSHAPAEEADVAVAIEGLTYLGAQAGLDFFDTEFLFVTEDQMNAAAAQDGFPIRYPHWRFGMELEKMEQFHRKGQGKIFELVLNTDACVAYLQETNSLFENILVIAHVLGHSDFFKNNVYFKPTPKNMYKVMEQHASFIQDCINEHGIKTVENFIDHVLAATTLYNPYRAHLNEPTGLLAKTQPKMPVRVEADPYLSDFVNPEAELTRQTIEAVKEAAKKDFLSGALNPTRDVLRTIIAHSDHMQPWQRSITEMLLEETEYFAPQMLTKIVNEGWATFWHHKLLADNGVLQDSEVVEYGLLNAGVLAMPKGAFNPYAVGYKLFKYIERTQGLEECFWARSVHSDASFIGTYLTQEFCEEENLFTYKYNEWRRRYEIDSRDFMAIREQLLNELTNYNTPRIYALAVNHHNDGTLLLEHRKDATEPPELDLQWAPATLKCLANLWGRDVHLRYMASDKPKTMICEVEHTGPTSSTFSIRIIEGHK